MTPEECREQVLSEDYRNFLIPAYRSGASVNFPESQACVQDLGFGYRVVYIDKNLTGELTIERFQYNNIPKCYALLDTDAMSSAGISAVQNYPTLKLQGNGVMIGFVDTGIDYANPIFRKMDGGTRIAGLWDQTVQTGPLPEGFTYGSEYTEERINEALRSDAPREIVPSTDEIGHGTFLAGLAAGGEDPANRFLGAAPRASLGVVKLKRAKAYLKEFYAIGENAVCFQEDDIMQGLYYLHKLAYAKGMPLVLCVALGSNFGGHNGTSQLSRILDSYAGTLNRCVIIGGGNEANRKHHYFGAFASTDEKAEAEIRVEAGNTGFVAELWSTLPNVMTAYIVSPSGERSQSISIRQGSRYGLTFPFERTHVDVEYRLLQDNNDSQLIFFRFRYPAAGLWRIGVRPLRIADGEYDIWLPVQEFLDGDVSFLEPDPDTTLTEPGSTGGAIVVSYYNGTDNSIDINSGRGYTRNRLIKPELAAPGVMVLGPDPDGRYVKRSGSSIAAGITAGAAALIVEWLMGQPVSMGVTTSQVANIMILGAEQGVFPDYPNREWGYGRLDVYQSLDRLRSL